MRDEQADLYVKKSSGAGRHDLEKQATNFKVPTSWSRDGRFILEEAYSPGTSGYDLWIRPMTGNRKPYAFLETRFEEMQGQFSPDGRWVAYTSDESGRRDVYVARFELPTASSGYRSLGACSRDGDRMGARSST